MCLYRVLVCVFLGVCVSCVVCLWYVSVRLWSVSLSNLNWNKGRKVCVILICSVRTEILRIVGETCARFSFTIHISCGPKKGNNLHDSQFQYEFQHLSPPSACNAHFHGIPTTFVRTCWVFPRSRRQLHKHVRRPFRTMVMLAAQTSHHNGRDTPSSVSQCCQEECMRPADWLGDRSWTLGESLSNCRWSGSRNQKILPPSSSTSNSRTSVTHHGLFFHSLSTCVLRVTFGAVWPHAHRSQGGPS